jgi:hypothetical protein
MSRTGVVAALLACALAGPAGAIAQTTAPPEGWVVLPVDEYRALRDKAQPPPPVPPGPPVEATLTRVDYDLHIDGDTVAGRAVLTIDVLRDGWTKVQIPAGLMVRDAQLDGRPVSLVGGPPPHVLLDRAGRSLLTLEVSLPLTTAAGTESIALPAASAPMSRAQLVVSRAGVELSTNGGFVAERTESANDSRFTVFGRPNQAMTLTWRRKTDDRRAELPLRFRARVTELAAFGEDSCQITAAVRVDVLQGLAREVALALPQGMTVNQVNGPTVGDWQVAAGTLRIGLLDAVGSEVSFVVSADARVPREGIVTVPIIRVPEAERETGGIAVDVVGAGEIGGRQARGLEPADPSELGEPAASRQSPSMLAFRHAPLAGGQPRALAVTIVRYTPQAVLVANVEQARYRALVSEDGRLLVEARYAVRNNQRSFLKVALPPRAAVWSAEVSGRPIRPGAVEHEAVLLPLEKGRAGEEAPLFAVSIVYLQTVEAWSDRGRMPLDLPAIDLPVSRTAIELHYSPRFRIEPQPGAFRVAPDPGPLADLVIGGTASTLPSPPPPPPAAPVKDADAAAAGLQALASQFRDQSGGRTVVGALPVHVNFPGFGPALFLVSELTAEGATPSVDLLFRRSAK